MLFVRKAVVPVGILVLASLGFLSQSSQASMIELLNWSPVPDSVHPPFAEINYNGANLQTDVGAISNGDGNALPAGQTPGGLQVDTIVNAPSAVAFSFSSSVFTGGTGYYDTTLTFTGLTPFGNATQTTIPSGPVLDAQGLTGGTFTLFSTNIGAGPIVLLQGTINNAVITGVDGGASGAVLDAHGITYTGGLIFSALSSDAVAAGNDMSIAMTSVTPSFGISSTTLQLNPFTADATGGFDINVTSNTVPEPASLTLGLIGVAAFGMRRRRRAM